MGCPDRSDWRGRIYGCHRLYGARPAVLHGGEPYRTEANGLVPETVGGGTVTAAQPSSI